MLMSLGLSVRPSHIKIDIRVEKVKFDVYLNTRAERRGEVRRGRHGSVRYMIYKQRLNHRVTSVVIYICICTVI